MEAGAAFDSGYWLSHCEGFRVEAPGGLLGFRGEDHRRPAWLRAGGARRSRRGLWDSGVARACRRCGARSAPQSARESRRIAGQRSPARRRRGRLRLKSFNEASGYGFIEPEEGEKDLWVHRRSVIGDDRETLTEGERVEFEFREGGMGPEAINVLRTKKAGGFCRNSG
jgi:cold shock protein